MGGGHFCGEKVGARSPSRKSGGFLKNLASERNPRRGGAGRNSFSSSGEGNLSRGGNIGRKKRGLISWV